MRVTSTAVDPTIRSTARTIMREDGLASRRTAGLASALSDTGPPQSAEGGPERQIPALAGRCDPPSVKHPSRPGNRNQDRAATGYHQACTGAAAPDPAAYGLSPPLFQPLTAYAARGRIYPAPARGGPHPRVWAISGPLDPVTSGSPRSSPDTSASRSGCIEAWTVQIPKLTVRVRFPSPAPTVTRSNRGLLVVSGS